jgi:hypothetical protein
MSATISPVSARGDCTASVVVGPDLQPQDPIEVVALCAEHDHRQRIPGRAQVSADIEIRPPKTYSGSGTVTGADGKQASFNTMVQGTGNGYVRNRS